MENKMLELLKAEGQSPSKLAKRLKISRQALHRHLKSLLEKNLIRKIGATPHVSYRIENTEHESRVQESFLYLKRDILPVYSRKKFIEKAFKKLCKRQKTFEKLDFKFMLDSAAVYSSNIEGNTLNLNSFLNSRSQSKRIRPKEAQEIEDLVEAYSLCQNHPLSEKNMLRAHALLSSNFLNKARQGKYRKEPVGVFSSRGLEYLAAPAAQVNAEMFKLFTAIDTLMKARLSPVETFFWASWIHLLIALIHPFSDGNGRLARLCEKWFLIQKLGTPMIFLPSEEYYFKNRPAYYAALRLGVNYWETDFKLCKPFIELLPQALLAH